MKQKLKSSPNLRTRLARFWSDERGQSTTEYILILSVVVMVAMKFKSVFSQKLMQAVDNVGNNIDTFTQDSGN
jgi:Flp pilus assembly pilin Flp